MPKPKRILSLVFLLPSFLVALSLSIFLLCNGFSVVLRFEDEPTCPPVQDPRPEPGFILPLKEEALPEKIRSDQIPRLTYKISRKNRTFIKNISRSVNPSQFGKRIAEFFSGSSPNLTNVSSTCSLRFFMTWISPLKYFGPRELFAIESLFKSHKKACLLIVSSTMDSSKGNRVLRPFLDSGFRVTTISPDFAYLVKGTPAETWYNRLGKGQVDPGEVALGQNLSNLLRLLILYKYGGIYIDTDVIIMRSFVGLKNCIGAQTIDLTTHNWSRLNNAVMVFDEKHPLIFEFIKEFASTFDGNKWGHNGPYLVSRVFSRVERNSNYSVNVLQPVAFYPVNWSRIGSLFSGPTSESHAKWIRGKLKWIRSGSFALHLWNRQSRGMKVEKGSVIAKIISDCCLFCNSSVQGSSNLKLGQV